MSENHAPTEGREVVACEECHVMSWDVFYDDTQRSIVGLQTRRGSATVPMTVTPALQRAARDGRKLWLMLVDEHGDAAAGLERAVKAEADRDKLQHEATVLRARMQDALLALREHETKNAIGLLKQALGCQ